MIDAELFAKLDSIGKVLRRNKRPFGGNLGDISVVV